jgi:sugar phosphate isomerase/epimerase
MNISRRNMLRLGAGAAALMAVGAGARGEEPAAGVPEPSAEPPKPSGKFKKVPIGLQLYSVRQDFEEDPPGVLKAIGEMGYEAVEFAGYVNRTAEDLRKMLDQSGLKCCGTHTNLDTLQGDALKSTIEFNRILGNKHLIVPGLTGSYLSSEENILKTARIFTELSDKCKEEGMRVGYHSHDADFRKIGDRTVWNILFTAAGPDVIAQLDLGHCVTGGGDVYAELEKFADRAVTIHVTDATPPAAGGRGRGTIVGEGGIDFERVFKICDVAGKTEWYVIEQEVYPRGITRMESVKRCLENIKKVLE